MNDFISNLTSRVHTYKIQKDSDLSAKDLNKRIDSDYPPKEIQEGRFSVIYVYYLYGRKVRYNDKKTDVLYIGSSIGEKKGNKISLGYRFKHLLSGKDKKQNVVLSYYYNQGYTIGLDIFDVEDCRNIEKKFIYDFIIKYKSQPAAQGASYNKKLAECDNK